MKEETFKILKANNRSPEDVMWCGSQEFGWFTFEDFMEIAPVDYDYGFGAQEIAKDLLVVGKDFWLERHEYDGSEWWEFKTLPSRPKNYNKPNTIMNGDGWATLVEMNRKGGKYPDDEEIVY